MLAPLSRLGPYEILAPIGAGGMGEVYRARDTRLGREVAVKVLPAGFAADRDRLRRFEQEAKATAALEHPNILAIYDIGTHEGTPYIVEQLLEGESLRQRLGSGPLTPSKAVALGVQIAQGLAAAHEKGIVHRDLKPENLFITKDGRIKILDFGLARLKAEAGPVLSQAATAASPTREGKVFGTPGYMAPEQVRGHPVDCRADLFAFGVVLYEMLAGKRAFVGDTDSDVAAAILAKDPPPLSGDMPPVLAQLILRCLEKRPEDRFSSAHDVALALEAISGATPTPSGPISGAPEHRARSKRYWAAAAAAALIVALAAAGLWLWKGRPAKPAPPLKTESIKSIAVYPLDDLSADAAQSVFAPTMTDALNVKLTQIKSLRVVGQVSAERCKQEKMPLPKVAEVLGVDAVVQGTVAHIGDTVRISVRLVDARTDSNLWAESYERKLSDVLVLQGEVAQAIATSLRAAVSPEERTRLAGREVDPRAYDEYLSALADLEKHGPQSYVEAIAHLKKAIELDPQFSLAYAKLSGCYGGQWDKNYVPYRVAYPLAKAAALKAVEVGPSEAASHAGFANFLFTMERDLPGAERESRRALDLDAKNQSALRCLALTLAYTGRGQEAVDLRRRAVELDPRNPGAWQWLSVSYSSAGQWDDAIRAWEKKMELAPNPYNTVWMAWLHALKGDRAKALAYADKAKTLPGWNDSYIPMANLAWTYAVLGMRPEAEEILRLLKPLCIGNSTEELDLGGVYAWLGETDRAFGHLEKAVGEPGWYAFQIADSESFPKAFTRDPRYAALIQKLGLPPPKLE